MKCAHLSRSSQKVDKILDSIFARNKYLWITPLSIHVKLLRQGFFWNTSRRLLSIYIGFCFNLQNGEIHKNVLPMPCIWIQPLPVTSHWWIKNSGFRERKGVFEPVATFVFVLIPWILRKYTKNFHCFFFLLFFDVYDIISKNLMGLVHWWVMLYLFGGDGITFKSYFNSLLTISYSQKR